MAPASGARELPPILGVLELQDLSSQRPFCPVFLDNFAQQQGHRPIRDLSTVTVNLGCRISPNACMKLHTAGSPCPFSGQLGAWLAPLVSALSPSKDGPEVAYKGAADFVVEVEPGYGMRD